MSLNNIYDNVNAARKELLDLSLKNPLLNFKTRKYIGLSIEHLNCIEVFKILQDEKSLSFTKKYDPSKPGRIYTSIEQAELATRLAKTHREAKLVMEEKGCNVLFLALGFIKWYEPSNKDESFRAPLVLVPITLKKSFDIEKYSVEYTFEDIQLNVSLSTKFKNDFGIHIPYEVEEFNIEEYFYEINKALQESSSLKFELIDDCGAIDFFSYAKFLMYMDLDMDKVVQAKSYDNSVLHNVFNQGFTHNEVKECGLINIVGSDYSQTLAIKEVLSNNNIVIQGPPGTGKSQTITNIISNAVYHGKKVLFVSEKKAALDVVKRRLDATGLSDLVLELHSQSANKKNVLQSIEKTLKLGEPRVNDIQQMIEKYDSINKYLNKYADLVNSPVKNSSLSLITIYGLKLELEDKLVQSNTKIPKLDIDGLDEYSEEDFLERYELLKEYVETLKQVGRVAKHPFYGLSLKEFLPIQEASLNEKLDEMLDVFYPLLDHTQELSNLLSCRGINNIFDFKHYYDSIMYCKDFNGTLGMNSADYRFSEDKKFILTVIEKGKKASKFYNDYKHLITIRAFTENKFDVHYEVFKNSGVAFVKDKSKEDKVLSYFDDTLSRRNKLVLAKKLYNLKRDIALFKNERKQIKEVFKEAYSNPFDTDWASLEEPVSFLFKLHEHINDYTIISQMKFACMDINTIKALEILAVKVQEDIIRFEQSLNDFCQAINFDAVKRFGYSKWYLDMPFTDLRKILLTFKSSTNTVCNFARYNDLEDQMYHLGLNSIVEYAIDTKDDLESIVDMFLLARYDNLIHMAFDSSTELKEFKSFKHERQREMFKDLNAKLMLENIKTVLKKHFDEMPNINDSTPSINILRREFLKKKNNMPIRKLLSQTKDSLLSIKPVFMMSPISIATFLEPGSIEFDLVIFDEASQVRPVEAFGALLRSRQAVVVGDSKQLPPTNFFENITAKNEGVTDDDEFTSMESILSLFLAKKAKELTLSIHYRSRHHSLIETSNEVFYENKLEIFPSTDYKSLNEGLIFKYNPKSVYNRGTTRSNPIEADDIIDAIIEHSHNCPHLSLGIVAFSVAQTEEIYRRLEKRLKKVDDDELKKFLSANPLEPFFIKNLENVQGDERDVIFISIGYGHDSQGNLSMDFGPLNRDGGERRLNVLITRAKTRCVVFSNINCYNINMSKTNAKGIKALKSFLEYAEYRKAHLYTIDEANDSFENFLYNKLVAHGFEVDKNIGSKSQVIDLAIKDPRDSSKYLVGILCDGNFYYQQKSSIDRDILRDSILYKFNWRIYHVWSTDFYQNYKYEFEKLLDFINNSLQQVLKQQIEDKQEVVVKRKASKQLNKELSFEPYQLYSGPMKRQSIWQETETLKQIIKKIIEIEAPIHAKEIQRRLLIITKSTSMTQSMKNNLEIVFQELKWDEHYEYRDDFFYVKDRAIIVRNREAIPQIFRKLESISQDEIRLCLYTLIDFGSAQTLTDLTNASAIIFGFAKPSDKYKMRINDALQDLINANILYLDEEVYYVNEEVQVEKQP